VTGPRALAACAALLALAGCAQKRHYLRTDSLGSPSTEALGVADVPVCGYPVRLLRQEGGEPTAPRELLALDGQALWIAQEGRAFAVQVRPGDVLLVEVLPDDRVAVGVALGLGALSTVTHGGFIVISLPLWLFVGGNAYATAARAHAAEHAGLDERIAHFARFPQGRPAGWPAEGVEIGSCGPPWERSPGR
jgi:hypothetical protein